MLLCALPARPSLHICSTIQVFLVCQDDCWCARGLLYKYACTCKQVCAQSQLSVQKGSAVQLRTNMPSGSGLSDSTTHGCVEAEMLYMWRCRCPKSQGCIQQPPCLLVMSAYMSTLWCCLLQLTDLSSQTQLGRVIGPQTPTGGQPT